MQEGGSADGSGTERDVLDDLLADVRRHRKRLGPASVWQPALDEFEDELESGQPFLLRVASASESRSSRDESVVSS